ncbi:MAG: hypothetical protein OXG25_07005 [Gammaproteobacteria bacterium]|nr:hypothetical protein [Gammaproteobacteria bacterium]
MKSRDRATRFRAGLLFLFVCVWSVSLPAQECDELEGDDLTVCLTLMVCMALDEAKARNQCLEVARQVLDQHDAQKEASKQVEQVIEDEDTVTTARATEETTPVLMEEPVQDQPMDKQLLPTTAETSQSVQSATSRTEATRGSRVGRLFSWMRRGDRNNAEEIDQEDAGLTKDGVPKQFAATVVAVSQAGYNDALVVLSNRYVFVVSRARQSRIGPGDVIVARKKEGLSGRLSFLFYGRGASVDAHRVECGHVDPSRQTRRRCEFAARHLGTEPL